MTLKQRLEEIHALADKLDNALANLAETGVILGGKFDRDTLYYDLMKVVKSDLAELEDNQ